MKFKISEFIENHNKKVEIKIRQSLN